jgi:hypothetical protein
MDSKAYKEESEGTANNIETTAKVTLDQTLSEACSEDKFDLREHAK